MFVCVCPRFGIGVGPRRDHVAAPGRVAFQGAETLNRSKIDWDSWVFICLV